MKETFFTHLLIVGAILVFLYGLSSSVEYQTFSDSKSYSEAHVACQGYNYKHLAKINELDELTQAKTASGYSNLEKYWTALQVFYDKVPGKVQWRWSDTGVPFAAKPKMYNIVHVDDARNLVETGPIKVYCFLVTSGTFLEIETCSENHAYVCERSDALSTGMTELKSTQIRPTTMATRLMSEVTATFKNKATDTTKILASKKISISTPVPTSISNTLPTSVDLEEKITEYLIKLKQLSVDEEDSLQVTSCHPFSQGISSITDCLVDQSKVIYG